MSGFDEASVNSRIDALSTVSGPRRLRLYTALADRVARTESPLIAYRIEVAHDVFAPRVGCIVYQPGLGVDLAHLCLRR